MYDKADCKLSIKHKKNKSNFVRGTRKKSIDYLLVFKEL